VFHEEHSFGYLSANGTWSGMMALLISGIADIGVGDFVVSKERSEVVAFTDTLGLLR
jgi:ABC-type amino acid transport substrate-binding protein